MNYRGAALGAACFVVLSACSFQNKYEKEADKITRAVIANNVQDVKGDFDSKVAEQMTHARVGALSDELDDQGKYEGLKKFKPPTVRRALTVSTLNSKSTTITKR